MADNRERLDLAAIAARVDEFRDYAFSEDQQKIDDFDALISEVDRSRANLRLAAGLLDFFDPTSGSDRARVFVSDLRNCLEIPL